MLGQEKPFGTENKMADDPAFPIDPPEVETGASQAADPAPGPTPAASPEKPAKTLQKHSSPHSKLEFPEAIGDAESLLHYAAQAGIDLPEEIVKPILVARVKMDESPLDATVVAAFLAAYAKLAARLAPVTADTVCVSNSKMGSALRANFWGAIVTTGLVVVFSLLLFITSSISKDISDGIATANNLAALARAHVGAPAPGSYGNAPCAPATKAADPEIVYTAPFNVEGMIVELQSLAATIRDIHTSAIKLNWFVLFSEVNPAEPPKPPMGDPQDALQLQPSLIDLRAAAFCKINTYQYVRNFAQNVRADSVLIYGSIATYVLPVLLALLGALAFNLRDYTLRVKARTYHVSHGSSARIIVAVIAGAIISLFSGFAQVINLAPLPAAFLVGYGVEIFFAFLDKMLVAFGATKDASPPDGAKRSG